jgi:hypothetical protein
MHCTHRHGSNRRSYTRVLASYSVLLLIACRQDQSYTNLPLVKSLDEEHRISSRSTTTSQTHRLDSAVEINPASPTRTYTNAPSEARYYVYPPLITGHGQLMRGRQTVPAWVGVLIIVGGFAWIVGCAFFNVRTNLRWDWRW